MSEGAQIVDVRQTREAFCPSTLLQVVVDGDDVDPHRGSVEVCRQQRDERFAFTGLHFRDAALMQDDAADDLNAVRTDAKTFLRSRLARESWH